MNIIKTLISWYRVRSNPLAYVRSLGVTVGRDARLINIKPGPGTFGSEPYLVTLGDHVTVTANVQFVTHDGGVWVFRDTEPDMDVFGEIVVGNNVFIGYGAILMPNVHVGNNVVIGAGAIVTKDVPDNVVVAGVPARVVSSLADYQQAVLSKCLRIRHLSAEQKKAILLEKYRNHGKVN
jgi:acyl-[acyl carrier protein]--UDP-N-acetylglucosamine O-acyltransferase